jgi:hypothetical protein
MTLCDELPHFIWDKYFSGDQIFDYMGIEGFDALMTCGRDRLPSGIPKKYLKKTDTGGRSKVAKFNQPIVLVHKLEVFQQVHVSFQSTSSCNLSSVNLLPKTKFVCCAAGKGPRRAKMTLGN